MLSDASGESQSGFPLVSLKDPKKKLQTWARELSPTMGLLSIRLRS